jgi:hypothetical protein
MDSILNVRLYFVQKNNMFLMIQLKREIALGLFLIIAVAGISQTQTVRGKMLDAQAKYPLIGAAIFIKDSLPIIGTVTDVDGNFVLTNVPIGRQSFVCQYLGYKSKVISNIVVTSGKEVLLEIALEESVESLNEFVISGSSNKDRPNNDLAKVSARTFSLEEVNRYSGGRNDVSRLAASFAGVSAPNDSRNDIVVRGNSPTGLLWRIEGIPMANTNHFSTLGATGGPVSALNTNLLKTSDFLTAAFPAEYGNANGAVFDIEMRNGNDQNAEYTAQLSVFSGLEFMAEGPINKEKGTSYLASYRYGIASLAATGTSATPYYQDLSYHLKLGKTPIGRISLFGLLGTSSIDFFGEEIDETDLFADPDRDAYISSTLGLVGMKVNTLFSERTYLKTSVGVSTNRSVYDQDNLVKDTAGQLLGSYRATEVKDFETRYTMNSVLTNKFNARFSLRSGIVLEMFDIDANIKDRDNRVEIPDNNNDGEPDYFITTRNTQEQFLLSQYFSQGEYKFTDNLSLTLGLHAQHLTFTSDYSIEPRTAISWQFKPKQRISLGYGLHSQMVPLPIMLYREQDSNGEFVATNDNLEFTKSHHFVLGYDLNLGKSWRVKTELYYQSLFNIPIESTSSSYSLVNEGADFVFNENGSLVNEGTATNYGVELTIEKFFSKGFYMLATGSMYESLYKGSDNVERSTAFNNQLVGNILLGREWKIGKSKKNAITIDTKLTSSQGNPYTPINLNETIQNAGREVLATNQAYSQRYEDYFRWDVKFGIQFNSKKKKVAHKFYIDLQNVLNRKNEFTQRYNQTTGQINRIDQIGFFPDVLYRIQF